MKAVALAIVCAVLGGVAGAALVLALDDTAYVAVPESGVDVEQEALSPAGLTPAQIYRRDAPGVVFISAEVVRRTQSPFDLLPEEQRGRSTGTGFVIDEDGSLLTNAHVVEDATAIRVRFRNGRTARARLRGVDPSTDLALLRVDPEATGRLRPLRLGSSRSVRVGDPTVAIGNPFGLDLTLTTGVVSAKARRIEAPNGFQIEDVLQTDAAINPGNSGGPLIDARGRVIGINSAIRTGGQGSGSIGIAFAVPADTARRILPQLREEGRVERAFLGVSAATMANGAFVQDVVPGGPADAAGLRPGDVLTAIGGARVRSAEDIPAQVERHEPGERVELEVLREGGRATLAAELTARPG